MAMPEKVKKRLKASLKEAEQNLALCIKKKQKLEQDKAIYKAERAAILAASDVHKASRELENARSAALMAKGLLSEKSDIPKAFEKRLEKKLGLTREQAKLLWPRESCFSSQHEDPFFEIYTSTCSKVDLDPEVQHAMSILRGAKNILAIRQMDLRNAQKPLHEAERDLRDAEALVVNLKERLVDNFFRKQDDIRVEVLEMIRRGSIEE